MKQRELTLILCGLWVLTLLYTELITFWIPSLAACSWPHLYSSLNSSADGAGNPGSYVKIAVIADPQLMDRTSLALPPKSFALEMAQFYTDLYMRRAFQLSILPFKPDVILHLGDLFDGGPRLSDQEWQESLSRFKHIFALDPRGRHRDVKVHFLSGNHDTGYETTHIHLPQVVRRYEKEFGERNYRFTAGKIEFIAIDAQTMDAQHLKEPAFSTLDFVKNVSSDPPSYPTVLLTHIPLYRKDETYCGPHRKSPVINQRIVRKDDKEISYQNYVSEESSNLLLEMIKPVLILSGHDHDQCTITHKSTFSSVVEHTVGTISWQQGNLYPSFMLLSASNFLLPNTSSPDEAVLTQLCFLPRQTFIYIWYIVLFIFSLLAMLLWPTNSTSFMRQLSECLGYMKQLVSFSTTKEKNEDLDCEYEMIWDAEGSMHLVKKAATPLVTRSSDTNPERGSAVIRPTARKNIWSSQESDILLSVDNNADMTKLPQRASKSWRKIVIQRLLRTFIMLSIIVAVNVPLYMILLFKDWIDQ